MALLATMQFLLGQGKCGVYYTQLEGVKNGNAILVKSNAKFIGYS